MFSLTERPLKAEFYGPCWQIFDSDPSESLVIIPDPGDGSAGSLAIRILDLMNQEPTDENRR